MLEFFIRINALFRIVSLSRLKGELGRRQTSLSAITSDYIISSGPKMVSGRRARWEILQKEEPFLEAL
jgi:hypothetical protein